MSEAENEPIRRWQVVAIMGTIVTTLGGASFIYAMRADIDKKANRGEVSAIRSELRDIRGLLCDTPENMNKQACRLKPGDYREHEE
jgi:hypothetical protein